MRPTRMIWVWCVRSATHRTWMPLMRMGGDRQMGPRTHLHLCVPIGAHLKREEIHDETKRGLGRGLVTVQSALYSSTVHEHEGTVLVRYAVQIVFPIQRYGERLTYKVRAFFPCANPVEHVRGAPRSIRSKRNTPRKK
jgi:hypothetical protein